MSFVQNYEKYVRKQKSTDFSASAVVRKGRDLNSRIHAPQTCASASRPSSPYSTEGETRTRKPSRAVDFESTMYTIPSLRHETSLLAAGSAVTFVDCPFRPDGHVMKFRVDLMRFELTTSRMQIWRSTNWNYGPKFFVGGEGFEPYVKY